MNAWISEQLGKIDDEIAECLKNFEEIKRKIPYDTYQLYFAHTEKLLQCRVSFQKCTCTPVCNKYTPIDCVLDDCNEKIDMYYENPDFYSISVEEKEEERAQREASYSW